VTFRMRVCAVLAALAACVWLVAALAAPAMAQDLPGLQCPDGGIAGSICRMLAPLFSVIIQIVGVAVGVMIILWVIRLIH